MDEGQTGREGGDGAREAPCAEARGDFVLRSALADLVSGVAHEIRNPINTISLTSQVVQKLFEKKGLDFDEFREYFRVIHFEVGKIKKIIDNFVKFARIPDLELEPVELTALLEGLVSRLQSTVTPRKIELHLETPGPLELTADRTQLEEAFLNILENSVQLMPDGGRIDIRVRRTEEGCTVMIQDDGPGIQPEDPDRIFHPYYTTSPGGLGLGLTLSRSIIESHGGTIRAGSREQGGAEFTIELPLGGGSKTS